MDKSKTEYQPDSGATACLPCAHVTLGVYCPSKGSSTPTPCPGGTYSNATGLYSDVQCTSVEAGYYAPTGSQYPEQCPASGFTCPGRAADEVNDPPGAPTPLALVGVSCPVLSCTHNMVTSYNKTFFLLDSGRRWRRVVKPLYHECLVW